MGRVTADSDLSQTFEDESFIGTLVESVNDAGGNLALSISAVTFAEHPSYTTQVTYTVRGPISSNTNTTALEDQLTEQLTQRHPGVQVTFVTHVCAGNPCLHGNCTESVQSGEAIRMCACEDDFVFDENRRVCMGLYDAADANTDSDDGPGVDWGYAFGALVLVVGLFCASWVYKGNAGWMCRRERPEFQEPPGATKLSLRNSAAQSTTAAPAVQTAAVNDESLIPASATPRQTGVPSSAAAPSANASRYLTQGALSPPPPSPSAAPQLSSSPSTAVNSRVVGHWQRGVRQVNIERNVLTRVSRDVPADLDADTLARMV